jgi:hypothetical protein
MAMRARAKSLHTRAVKVKVPGKHFSGLAPSEQQKAVYVCLRSVHEKRISLYFTVHSVWAGGPHSNSLSSE